MASNSRKLSRLLGTDTKIGIEDVDATIPVGVQFYDNDAALPADGGVVGAKAYTVSEAKFYFWNGDVWGPLDIAEWDYTPPPFVFQGSSYGFQVGGRLGYGSVEQYSFISDGNSVSIGNISGGQDWWGWNSASISSANNGYMVNDEVGGKVIIKFSFVADGFETSSTPSLTATNAGHAGISSGDTGYFGNGHSPSVLHKFTIASEAAGAVAVVAIPDDRTRAHGVSDTTNGAGYIGLGGGFSGATYNRIKKFSFANDNTLTTSNATAGVITNAQGASSATSGYWIGGTDIYANRYAPEPGEAYTNAIQKWPFATDTNAVDVADLTYRLAFGASSSSTANGYTAGNYRWGQGTYQFGIIQKFSFVTDTNAANIGNLTTARGNSCLSGFQV
jgi:hypothetical protein